MGRLGLNSMDAESVEKMCWQHCAELFTPFVLETLMWISFVSNEPVKRTYLCVPRDRGWWQTLTLTRADSLALRKCNESVESIVPLECDNTICPQSCSVYDSWVLQTRFERYQFCGR